MSFVTISPVALVAYLDFYLFLNYINTFLFVFHMTVSNTDNNAYVNLPFKDRN